MKKMVVVITMLLLILAGCSAQQASNKVSPQAKETYSILVKAENGHRDLTASEEKTVKAFDQSLENRDKLGNAIHAMYFNLGVDNKFNEATNIANKYME
jgi:uncharacterized protein YcfL